MKNIFIVMVSSMLFFSLVGCGNDLPSPFGSSGSGSGSDPVTNVGTVTVLTGSVSAVVGAARTGRTSRSAAASAEMESCMVEAYDMEDRKVAETQADENNGYEFKDGQLELGVDYKIVSNCSYNGQDEVKMSSYARTIPNKSAVPSPVEVNPKTTAIAVMIRKAIISAISAAESALGLDLFDVKVAILSSVSSIIDDMAQTLADDDTFVYPEDPLEASSTEKTISASLDLSNLTSVNQLSEAQAKMDNVTNNDNWDVSTAEAKIEAAEASGKQGLVCGVNIEDDGTEAAQCSQVLLEVFASRMGWAVAVDLKGADSHWYGKTCGETDMILPSSKYTYLELNGQCQVVAKNKPINKYGDSWGFFVTGEALQAVTTNLKKGTEYTLSDINNIIFKNDNSTDTGLGAWLGLNIHTGPYRGAYYYENEWIKHDNRSIDVYVYENQQYKPFSGVTNYNWMVSKYEGLVPNYDEFYEFVDSSIYFRPGGAINSTYWVVGKVPPPDNESCRDGDATTICYSDNGTNINELIYQIGVTWGLDAQGRMTIDSLSGPFEKQTKSKKNYELKLRSLPGSDSKDVAYFNIVQPGGREVRNTDDTEISFYFVFKRPDGVVPCPDLSDVAGTQLSCDDHLKDFIQLSVEYQDNGDEVFNVIGGFKEIEDNETVNFFESYFDSEGNPWGEIEVDNPLWKKEMDGILISDFQGSERTFSDFWRFYDWAIRGGVDPSLAEEDRLYRCSFWKESVYSSKFDNTSREICENADQLGSSDWDYRDENNNSFTHEYKVYSKQYWVDLQRNNNDRSANFPDFIRLDNLTLRDNAYRFDNTGVTMALLDFAFKREVFGSETWNENTKFNSAQAISLIFFALFERGNISEPQEGLEEYFTKTDHLGKIELKLSEYGIAIPAFGKGEDGGFIFWSQIANALDHPERLR
jgi:hypothetical protein